MDNIPVYWIYQYTRRYGKDGKDKDGSWGFKELKEERITTKVIGR